MLTDTIKWIKINLKVLDTINDNRSIIGSTEEGGRRNDKVVGGEGGLTRRPADETTSPCDNEHT